jgi:heptosyltransferase I
MAPLAVTVRRPFIITDTMTLSFNPPPQHVCLLRLSAIGDTCHALAALRALQRAWPQTRFTWIIGRLESRLMTPLLPEIEFIIFDKDATLGELWRLRKVLHGRRFDLLLDMQLSFRASLVSSLVHAPVKLGFDKARARELQWWFTNARIAPAAAEHVLDTLMGFVRACGVEPDAPHWDITLPAEALEYARGIVTDSRPTLLISPCSSHTARNWAADRYAAVAGYAAYMHRMRVVLVGGPSAIEREMGEKISAAVHFECLNQIGKDTLPQLLALLSQSTALLTPDSGPAHMATMVGVPVIGLYAATNPARAGPYNSRGWCVDKYDEAARKFLGRPAAGIAWTAKIERPGVMELIEVKDVTAKLDALLADRAAQRERAKIPQ